MAITFVGEVGSGSVNSDDTLEITLTDDVPISDPGTSRVLMLYVVWTQPSDDDRVELTAFGDDATHIDTYACYDGIADPYSGTATILGPNPWVTFGGSDVLNFLFQSGAATSGDDGTQIGQLSGFHTFVLHPMEAGTNAAIVQFASPIPWAEGKLLLYEGIRADALPFPWFELGQTVNPGFSNLDRITSTIPGATPDWVAPDLMHLSFTARLESTHLKSDWDWTEAFTTRFFVARDTGEEPDPPNTPGLTTCFNAVLGESLTSTVDWPTSVEWGVWDPEDAYVGPVKQNFTQLAAWGFYAGDGPSPCPSGLFIDAEFGAAP